MTLSGIFIGLFLFSAIAIDDDYRKTIDKLIKKRVDVIYPEDLFELLQKDQVVYLLDSREVDEYNVSRIKGARFVGFKKFDPAVLKDIPLSATVIVYCSVGYRSEKIGEKILKIGYKNVYNLYGGIFEWVNLSYPVYNREGIITPNIHGFSKKWSRWLKRGRITY